MHQAVAHVKESMDMVESAILDKDQVCWLAPQKMYILYMYIRTLVCVLLHCRSICLVCVLLLDAMHVFRQ